MSGQPLDSEEAEETLKLLTQVVGIRPVEFPVGRPESHEATHPADRPSMGHLIGIGLPVS